GARVLNELAIEAFGAAGPAVLHLAGTRDYDELNVRVSRPDYRVFAFTEEFGAALGASDLALARAGGSVWELAAAGKPAVLVPGLFATGDHQTKNARYFEPGGGATELPPRTSSSWRGSTSRSRTTRRRRRRVGRRSCPRRSWSVFEGRPALRCSASSCRCAIRSLSRAHTARRRRAQ